MILLEPFLPTPSQVAKRQYDQARRRALQRRAEYEHLLALADAAKREAEMYDARAQRLEPLTRGIGPSPELMPLRMV
jgi:hypothetical protein